MRAGKISFDNIQAASLAQAERLLADWFPAGKISGHEFKVGNIRGDAGGSLSINLDTGLWADFADGISGHDLIDLLAQMEHGGDRVAAARELADTLGIVINGQDRSGTPRTKKQNKTSGAAKKAKAADNWQPIVPPPPDVGKPFPYQLDGFNIVYEYVDADGRLLFYMRRRNARVNKPKVLVPLTYGVLNGKTGWHSKHPAAPRPLYRLDRLTKVVGLHDPIPAKVILCEGEKAADAAQAIFLDYACISWPGGVNSIKHVDLTPLQNRDVIIWPDNDGPGRKATIELRRILPNARVLRVDDLGDGDDAADVHPDNSESWFADRILPHESPPDTNTDDNHNVDGEWPRHFFSNKRGMWFEPPSTEKNPDPDPIWICAPFTAVAETADEAGNSWGLLLQWRDPNALDHQWAMPRRLLHADGNQIAMELEGAGLKVGTGKIVHELLKELLGRLTRLERKRCVMRCGWHQTVGGHPFLLPSGETFGKDGNSVVLQTNHVASADAIRQRGSLQEWQEHVGRYAIGNYRLALSISTSLTGPLLDIVGEPSGGLHLHGGSQIGKTTLLRSSASVSGRSNMGGPIRTWRATANGLESVAAETCDATLYLDEISMANAKEVGEIVYALPSEIGKVRAARDGSARSLLQTWRVMFLSTGEIPLAAKMQEHGITPMAGQEVRLISIPADAGVGLGVYQNLHGMSDGAALSQHLSEASRTYYGTAARAFLERLANDRGEDAGALMTRIRTMRDSFVKLILPPNADGQVISVAGRFALIAAAGELARSFGVLPWPDGESERAAAACFRAWLDARGGFGADEDMKAVAAVRRFIEQHGESRFTDLGSQGSLLSSKGVDGQHARRDTINRAGFRRKVEGTWEFWVFPEQWRTEVCKGLDSQRAAAAVP